MASTPLAPNPTYRTVPYLTVAELQRSPIYTQLQKLIPGGSAADNEAELAQIIMRVSAMINGEVNQSLAATTDTEAGWCTLSDFGELLIHARCTPIVEVISVSAGPSPYNMTEITDLTFALTDPWRITIPPQALLGINSPWGYNSRRLWVQWTYVNGYPVTTTTSAVTSGATSITVGDATGIIPNATILTIEDGKFLEQVVPTAVTGNVLTVPPLVFNHALGVGVNALPDDIVEAALLLVSRLHNTWSLAMGAITHDGTGARRNPNAAGIGNHFMCDPAVILEPYKRRW